MREGDAASKGLSPVMIIGAIIGLFVVIGVGFYIQQTISASAPVNVVVLKAENTSFKEKPEKKAEADDAGNRSSVMVMLDDMTKNKDDIEVISLNPEGPEMPEVKVDDVTENQNLEEATPTENELSVAQSDTDKAAESSSAENEVTEQAAVNTQAQPVKRPLTPLVSKNAPTKGPSMMVQLAAFRNQAKAEEVAALLTEKHKDRLQGLSLGIMQADTGDSGVFWRVTTEALPAEDATDLCNALKRAGQDCIFRKVALQ